MVHVNNPPDFLVLSAFVPKLLGARVIFDVHDLTPDMFAMRFGGRRGAHQADRLLRLIERAATGFADAVITVHEPYRRELVSRGVAPEKDRRRHEHGRRAPASPRTRARSGTHGFRVVYHGTITPHYGVNLLVEAVARVVDEAEDIRLEIYGDGDALPGVRKLAAELGITDRVWLSGGFLSQEEVPPRPVGVGRRDPQPPDSPQPLRALDEAV